MLWILRVSASSTVPTRDSPLGLGHCSQTVLSRKRSEEATQDFLNTESASRVPLPSSVGCCRGKQLPGHRQGSALPASWLENAVQLCQPLSLIWCPGGLTEEILCLEKIIMMTNKFTHPDGLAPPGFTARAYWPSRSVEVSSPWEVCVSMLPTPSFKITRVV